MSAYARSALLLASAPAPHRRRQQHQQRKSGKRGESTGSHQQQPPARRRQGGAAAAQRRSGSTQRGGGGNAGPGASTTQMSGSGLMSPLLLPQVAPPPRRGGGGVNSKRRGAGVASAVGANDGNDATAVSGTVGGGGGEDDEAMIEGSETQLNSVVAPPPLPRQLLVAPQNQLPPARPQTLGRPHQHMPPPNASSSASGHPPQMVQVAMMTAPSTRGPSYSINGGGYQAQLSNNDQQQHHLLSGNGPSTTALTRDITMNGSSLDLHNQNQQQTSMSFSQHSSGNGQQYFQQLVNLQQQQQRPFSQQEQQQPNTYATTFSQMSELDMSVTQMPPPPPPAPRQAVQSMPPPSSQATSSSSGASISASSKRGGSGGGGGAKSNKRARRGGVGVPPRERPWMSKCMDVVTRPVRNGVRRAIRPWVDRAMGAMMLSNPYESIQQHPPSRRVVEASGGAGTSKARGRSKRQKSPRRASGPTSDVAGGEVVAGSGGGGATKDSASSGRVGKGATMETSDAIGGNTSNKSQQLQGAVGGESACTNPPSAVNGSSGGERCGTYEPTSSSTTKCNKGREPSGTTEKRKPSRRIQETWSSSSDDDCSSDGSSDSDGTEYEFDWKRDRSRRKSRRGSRNERRRQDRRGRKTDDLPSEDTKKEDPGNAGIGSKGETHHRSDDRENGQVAEAGDLIKDSSSNLQPQPRSSDGGRGKCDEQGMDFSVPLLDMPTQFTKPPTGDAATAPQARNACDANSSQKQAGQVAAEVGTKKPGTIAAACKTRIEDSTMAYPETEGEVHCKKDSRRESSKCDNIRPDHIGSKDTTQTPARLLRGDDDGASDINCSYTMTCGDHKRKKCEDTSAFATETSGKWTPTDEKNTARKCGVENDVIDLVSSSSEESSGLRRYPQATRAKVKCQVQAKPHQVSTTLDVSMDERDDTSRKAACTKNTENPKSLSTAPMECGRSAAPTSSSSALPPLSMFRQLTPQKDQEHISFLRSKKVDVTSTGYSCGNAQAPRVKAEDSILDVRLRRNDDPPPHGSYYQCDRDTHPSVQAAQSPSRCDNDKSNMMHAGGEQRCYASVEKGIGSTTNPVASNDMFAVKAKDRSSKQDSSMLVQSSVSAAKQVETAVVVQEANEQSTGAAKTSSDIANAQEHATIASDMTKLKQTFAEVISQVAATRSGQGSLLPSEIQGGEDMSGDAEASVVLLGLIEGTVTKMVKTLLQDAKQEFVSAMKEHLSVSQAVSAPASVQLQHEPQQDPTQQHRAQQSDKEKGDDFSGAVIVKTNPADGGKMDGLATNKVNTSLCNGDGGVMLDAEPTALPNPLLQSQSHSHTQEFSSAGISSLTFDYCLPSQQSHTADVARDHPAGCVNAACDSGTNRGIPSDQVNRKCEGDAGQVQNTANQKPRKAIISKALVESVACKVDRNELQRQCSLQDSVELGSQNVEAGIYPPSCEQKQPKLALGDCCKQSGRTANRKLGRYEAEGSTDKAAIDSSQRNASSMPSPKRSSLHDPGNCLPFAQGNGFGTKEHSNEQLSSNSNDSPSAFDHIVVPETEQQLDVVAPLPSLDRQRGLDNSLVDICNKGCDDVSEKGNDNKENVKPLQEEGRKIRHCDDISPRSALLSPKTPKEESRASIQCSALKRRRRARGRKRLINPDAFVGKDETFRFGDDQMRLPPDTVTSRPIPAASKAKNKKPSKRRKRSNYSRERSPDIPRSVDVGNQPQTKKLQPRSRSKLRRDYSS